MDCPRCSDNERWNIDRFLSAATEIHENRYNYDEVCLLQKLTLKTSITLQCYVCDHIWATDTNNHTHGKYGCMKCFGNVPWNYDRFIQVAAELPENKYDYSVMS